MKLSEQEEFELLSLERERTLAGKESNLSAPGAAMQGINAGLTSLVGAPVDLMNTALSVVGLDSKRPIGGSAHLRRLLNKAIPNATYEELSEVPKELRPIARGAEVLGASILPAGAPFATSRAIQQVPGLIRPIVAAARSSPKTFVAAEAGSALGAAQGAALAEIFAPGSPAAAMTAEIAGGFVNPVGAMARGTKGAVGGVKTAIRGFSRAGREAKAADILQKAMADVGEDVAAVTARLREADLPNVSMTAGQKAESPTLLAFETTIASKNPDFDAVLKARTKENLQGLRKLIGDLEASGDPELLKVAAKTRENYFQNLLNERMRAAEAQVIRTSQTLGGDKAAASARATQILDEALGDARKVEKALWEQVPKDHPVSGNTIIEAHANVRAEMLPEEPLPPSFIEQFVNRVKKSGVVTSGEVQRFRSQMLLKAREARGQKKWGEARIYEDMADGALADMAEVPGKASVEARSWSKHLNDTFSRTFASDALATKGTGAKRIAPEAVLERAFGSGGTMANKRFEELQKAATVVGPKSGMIAEQEEFLRAAATIAVDPQTGAVNPHILESFKRNNTAMLERFPSLKRDLSDASSAAQAFRDAQIAMKNASRIIEQRAVFSQVLANESPTDAVRRIVNSAQPQQDYHALVKLAKRGPVGAVDGLKAATLDYAARTATSNVGEFSFARYREVLNRPMSGRGPSILNTMRQQGVMSNEEITRLNVILGNAARIERGLSSKAKMAELVAEPDALFDLVVRAVGANIGGASVVRQAAGAPIVMAGAGAMTARKLFEKVPRTRIMDVLMEASKNPQFMAQLLEKPIGPQRARDLHKQINAFLIQAGLVEREKENDSP